jgi:hypothetical protein
MTVESLAALNSGRFANDLFDRLEARHLFAIAQASSLLYAG